MLPPPSLIAIIGEAHRYPSLAFSGGGASSSTLLADACGKGRLGSVSNGVINQGLVDLISVVPEERWDVERWPLGGNELPAR